MLESSSLTRNKAGESTAGQASNPTSTRASSRQVSATVAALSGGQTAVGTRVNSRTVCNAVRECCTVKLAARSTRAAGRMECSTARECSSLTMVSVTKGTSRKTNSMEKACFTKTTRLFMAFGRITSCQW